MNTRVKRITGLFLSVFWALLFCFPFRPASGFYADYLISGGAVQTGTADSVIEGLRVSSAGSMWTEDDGNLNNGFLYAGIPAAFSFSVQNTGSAEAEIELGIEVSWSVVPSSAYGKLFVFPYGYPDADIMSALLEGDFSGAVVGSHASDEAVLADGSSGIYGTVDRTVLTQKALSKEYRFKLVLFKDGGILQNEEAYHAKKISVTLTVRGDVGGRQTGWSFYKTRLFRITSAVSGIYPAIREIARPKTFFVTQSGQINLKDYAAAEDARDGDITQDIRISCSPEFKPGAAGNYSVSYDVSNSLGFYAEPLRLTLTVWDFVKIVSGDWHTLALTSHGKVYAWGSNYSGQIGDGTFINAAAPKLIANLDGIKDIAAGDACSFAVDTDGQAYAWGTNADGRLGIGQSAATAVSRPLKVAQPLNVRFKSIAAGVALAGGVTTEGDVYTWGYGADGALGDGGNENRTAPAKINLADIEQLSFGEEHGAAVDKDGVLYTFGSNGSEQLGNPLLTEGGHLPAAVPYFKERNIKIASVGAGWAHTAAVSEDGKLFTWGYGAEGRLGNGSEEGAGEPLTIALPEPALKVAAEYADTAVLTKNGNVYYFGYNPYGQHGNGTLNDSYAPELLKGVFKATDVSLGFGTSFVLVAGEAVYGMGYGAYGSLGNGTNNNSLVPQKWLFTPPEAA